jgi:hypothetical protein
MRPSPDSQRQPQAEDGETDALQQWLLITVWPFRSSEARQQENDADPVQFCELDSSCLAGHDTDGRCEPVDPETAPADKADNGDDVYSGML